MLQCLSPTIWAVPTKMAKAPLSTEVHLDVFALDFCQSLDPTSQKNDLGILNVNLFKNSLLNQCFNSLTKHYIILNKAYLHPACTGDQRWDRLFEFGHEHCILQFQVITPVSSLCNLHPSAHPFLLLSLTLPGTLLLSFPSYTHLPTPSPSFPF